MKTIRTLSRATALATALALGLAACGGSSNNSADDAASDSTLATSATSVVVGKQWARASAMATTMGAAYMDITATGGDELVSASVDASVAESVELHEVVPADGDHSSGDHSSMGSDSTMAMSGEMKMQEVEKIMLPAGETVSLKPGGYHVMLMGLAKPLEVGTSISMTLTFATAGDITIDVPVLDEAP